MSPLRMLGSTSGYAELTPSAVAGDQTFTLPGTGGTLDRLNRAGNILQVVQTVKTDTTSSSSVATFADISGMSVSITPSSSSSKILILPDLALGGSDLQNYHLIWRLVRDSTAIAVSTSATNGDLTGTGGMHKGASGSAAYYFGCSKLFLDSPATTSQITYKCQWCADDAGATLYLNRRGSDTGAGAISIITAIEVAA